MDNNKNIQKLMDKANVSYEDAKFALEECKGDMLDAIVFLEDNGKINKPKMSVYYSNEVRPNYEIIETKSSKKKYSKRDGFFENICELIDKANNIYFVIENEKRVLIKLPLTAVLLLIIFAFWIIVPIAILLLFKGLKISVVGQNIDTSKINSIFDELSKFTQKLRKDSKKE